MHPPATAPPLTRQMVGNGKMETLPRRAMNSRVVYFWSYISRLEITLRSRPPLNSFDVESVTNVAGPS